MVSECQGSEEASQAYADRIKAFVMTDDKARGTVYMYSSALKSFFAHNGIEVPVGKVKNWVIYEDRAITQKELRKLLDTVDLRAKVMIAILAQSGLRVGTLAQLTHRPYQGRIGERDSAP